MSSAHAPIRVLLVDDSAVVRGAIGQIIDAEPDLTVVTTAPNGRVALDALRRVPVDVVVLDVEMPEMDGLATLPRIVAGYPDTRVLMASSLTRAGADTTLQALALGASDFVTKPAARVGTQGLQDVARDLTSKVRALGRAARGIRREPPAAAVAAPVRAAVLQAPSREHEVRLVAIAASTGGPNALSTVLSGLPADFPVPIVVTQHMPPMFTAMLAQRLARDTGRPCVEAADGQRIVAGTTYVAPGEHHLVLRTHEGEAICTLTQTPPENFCRPAADPMFRSVAAVYGASCLGVVLTGMGEDGMRGARDLRAAGASVIAQDEESSVVWGMPGAVVHDGSASRVLPLDDIARAILSQCGASVP
jgi:two-component system chemotaxis response regulator CheB